MKKIMIALVAMLTMSVSTHAMSYEQARNEALFLTDKMAYELNLTDEQYEAAYEINLDYLMGVTSVDDVYGPYWERRNLDLSYILMEAQWNAFIAASYFYRPLYWDAGYWHFGVYARYPPHRWTWLLLRTSRPFPSHRRSPCRNARQLAQRSLSQWSQHRFNTSWWSYRRWNTS